MNHAILSVCMTIQQNCSNFPFDEFMSQNSAGDSTGIGGDLGKVPF